ncbi:16S rRNA (cytosine(967)-C(5))-methyltransferase [Myxosarcina sp. GI1]|uniref:16S rRNA (cytosine(967)-C(5))-methyltransferase n=1 Tax=Myxosarcina sp. GI1 TaxID=1541065 RepID=UPI00056BF1C2|nr:16S rRNA (cytosine(967)-C(5))-methyltransferase [Myxosarcina sp. GI1]
MIDRLPATNSRQLAFLALKNVYQQQAYTDIALDRVLRNQSIERQDRGLVCELVYGVVRRQRTLDALIDRLGKKNARQQPLDLRIILHLGLYQLRYSDRIPPSAAVNTSVELAKANGLNKLAGVVNGILREYLRQAEHGDPLRLPEDTVQRLGILHSFPDWIVKTWLEQLSFTEAEKLAMWFNQSPHIDLRVNILKTTVAEVTAALKAKGVSVSPMPHLPQALRINNSTGEITSLPGYKEGWWVVQDSSAQLVSHFLDPQPGETIIDACAAPGGKTTHIAELMSDRGFVIACDRATKRLEKVRANAARLQLKSITIQTGDSRNLTQFKETGDRVLLDAPCSGLGTLGKRPDIRWRHPEAIDKLVELQKELLAEVATWVKPNGVLVYATCTLNYVENKKVIQTFLKHNPNWRVQLPMASSPASHFVDPEGWIEIYPHHNNMDGFFMVKLQKIL